MSSVFDDQHVYALSCLRNTQQHVPPVPLLSRYRKKHLRLLDAIALLLVTEGKDVAAVSFLHNRTSIEFYYTKNRPCTPQETAYVRKLLEMAKALKRSEKSAWLSSALDIVVQTCIKKVRGRMQKIIDEMRKCGISPSLPLEDIRNFPIWNEGDLKGEFRKAYERTTGPAEDSDRDILILYFQGLFRIGEPESRTKGVIAAVWLSYHIGLALREAPIISNSTLVRRIQKLGGYTGALRTLATALLDPAVFVQKDNIKFTEVKPCEQKMRLMPTNYVQILNSHAIKIGEPEVRWEDLRNHYPSLKDRARPEDGDVMVTTSVHCECTIATHLWKIAPARQKTFEIGMSKRCCWMCQKFLEFFAKPKHDSTSKFVVSGYQGKVHSGWRPPSWPTRPINRMAAFLRSEIEQILQDIKPIETPHFRDYLFSRTMILFRDIVFEHSAQGMGA